MLPCEKKAGRLFFVLSYFTSIGKLKPFGAAQENSALNKSQTVPSHQKNYKRHQVQTRLVKCFLVSNHLSITVT